MNSTHQKNEMRLVSYLYKFDKVNIVFLLINFDNVRKNDRDWNSWDDSPRTVDEHIEQYRQKLVQPPATDKQEPAIDFFQVCVVSFKLNLNN